MVRVFESALATMALVEFKAMIARLDKVWRKKMEEWEYEERKMQSIGRTLQVDCRFEKS